MSIEIGVADLLDRKIRNSDLKYRSEFILPPYAEAGMK